MKQKFWELYAITVGLAMFTLGAMANTPLLPIHLSQELVVIYMLLGPTIVIRTFVAATR